MLNLSIAHFNPDCYILLNFLKNALENFKSGVTQASILLYLLQPHRVIYINLDS